MEVADVLRRADAVLERYGWRKGRFGVPRAGFCLVGAVRFVLFDGDLILNDELAALYLRTVQVLHQAMAWAYPMHATKSVPMWNDLVTTTLEDIQKLLRTTIADITTA